MAAETSGRLAILGATIVVLWLAAALIGTLGGVYPSFNEALWDSIWHMIDPGALGDDDTTEQRILGVFLAVSGLIILAGAALTIFEEMVDRALGRIGASDPPLLIDNHLLVIGENSALPAIIRRVASTGDAGPAATVVLIPPGDTARRQSLRHELTAEAGSGDVRVVGGDLHDDGLERVCAADAARIVVLASETIDADAADLHVLGVGAILANALGDDDRPPIALQMNRGRNVDVVWDQFSTGFDALVEDRQTAATLALCLAHPVFAEALSGSDERTSVQLLDGCEGTPFGALIDRHPGSIPIGVLPAASVDEAPLFAPDPERLVAAGERVIALDGGAREESAGSVDGPRSTWVDRLDFSWAAHPQRLLLLGWSDAAESLVTELAQMLEINALTVVAGERPDGLSAEIGELRPEFITGRPNDPATLASVLTAVNPDRILIAATAATDAQAALAALQLERLERSRTIQHPVSPSPPVITEQSSTERAQQLRMGLDHGYVVSPAELTGQIVAHSASDPDALLAWQQMAAGTVGRIDRLRVHAGTGDGAGAGRPDFASVHRHLLARGIAPIGLAHGGATVEHSLRADTPVGPGDELLVVVRVDGDAG